MIRVQIVRDKEAFIWEFSIRGHAEYDKKGKDIVCAAVSAVAYTALGALDGLTGISNYSEKDGHIKCSLPLDIPEDKKRVAHIILETMAIGLKQIEHSYRKYVTVLDEEV